MEGLHLVLRSSISQAKMQAIKNIRGRKECCPQSSLVKQTIAPVDAGKRSRTTLIKSPFDKKPKIVTNGVDMQKKVTKKRRRFRNQYKNAKHI